ncbi:hypothetical protein GWI33_017312 [Rhynchophorus ferrugineus]|uniref:Defensin n=1 Tax=Rhynchophorus ferrugineus TaxID=354439 RepID=A0A834HYD6_RHYFE|nr:hypothetical protein GWI33_017312 [Rhynchophorus ferrugineus]
MQIKILRLLLCITLAVLFFLQVAHGAAIKEIEDAPSSDDSAPLRITCNGHDGGTTIPCTVHCMVDGYHYGVCKNGICHCKN